MKHFCIAVGYPLGFSLDNLNRVVHGYRLETEGGVKIISDKALLLWAEIHSSGEYFDNPQQEDYFLLTGSGLILEASSRAELLPHIVGRTMVRQGNGWLSDDGEWCVFVGDRCIVLDQYQMSVWQNINCFSHPGRFNELYRRLDSNTDHLVETLQFLCSNELVYIL